MPAAPVAQADGRFLVAFDLANAEDFWTWEPVWTRLDDHPNLVTSYTIDRGRQYELDRTDTGRAVVEIADPAGILDPTNPAGPYHGHLEPLLQAMIGRRNPITGEWKTRFRGFIEEFDYAFDPSQRVNRLTIQLVDVFEVLGAIEMQPGDFGYPPPSDVKAIEVIYFEDTAPSSEGVRLRLEPLLIDMAGVAREFLVLFSGNVALWETTYSPGESVMDVATDVADAEFPGVGNIYTDRRGRFVFHGRMARFDPEGISSGTTLERWDWNSWPVGDGTAVQANPAGTAQIREFSYERGLAKIINSASATPQWSPRSTPGKLLELSRAELTGQLYKDSVSIAKRGFRSWTAQNLQTKSSNIDGANALEETRRFAAYYVDNYQLPRNRITACGFRSINPISAGAAFTWRLLTEVDISDEVKVTVASPGGGGFDDEAFFVEGIHEEGRPLGTDDYDDVTLRLDLSPRAYYDTIPPGWS